MDAIRPVSGTRHNFVQKDHLLVRFRHCHVVIAHSREELCQLSQFMVMRGKKGERFQLWMAVQILDDRPCNRKPIIGAGTAPDLVQNQQAARRGIIQYVSGLEHFHHEGRLPLVNGILSANARENTVNQPNFSLVSRYKTADLRHQHDQHHLPQKSGLAAHVWTGDQPNDLTIFENGIVGNVAVATGELFDHRVTPCQDADALILLEDWS